MRFQMMRGWTGLTYKWAGIGLIALALFILILTAFGDRDSLIYRYWARYTSSIERKLRPMFIFTPGRVIAGGQLAAIFVLVVLELTVELPFFPVWLIAVCAVCRFFKSIRCDANASTKSKSSSTDFFSRSQTR